jgi:hypothetical protein
VYFWRWLLNEVGDKSRPLIGSIVGLIGWHRFLLGLSKMPILIVVVEGKLRARLRLSMMHQLRVCRGLLLMLL